MNLAQQVFSGEIARDTGLERHEAARRLSDLLNDALVRKGPARACSARGTTQATWLPARGQARLF